MPSQPTRFASDYRKVLMDWSLEGGTRHTNILITKEGPQADLKMEVIVCDGGWGGCEPVTDLSSDQLRDLSDAFLRAAAIVRFDEVLD